MKSMRLPLAAIFMTYFYRAKGVEGGLLDSLLQLLLLLHTHTQLATNRSDCTIKRESIPVGCIPTML